MDKKVFEAKSVTFHPMQNDALIEISSEDFKKYLKAIAKEPKVIDFVELKKGNPHLSRNHNKLEAEKEGTAEAAPQKKEEKKKKAGKKVEVSKEEEE